MNCRASTFHPSVIQLFVHVRADVCMCYVEKNSIKHFICTCRHFKYKIQLKTNNISVVAVVLLFLSIIIYSYWHLKYWNVFTKLFHSFSSYIPYTMDSGLLWNLSSRRYRIGLSPGVLFFKDYRHQKIIPSLRSFKL